MGMVTIKVPTLKDKEVGDWLSGTVGRIKGVTEVHADPATHNLKVMYEEGINGTTLTAIEKALDRANHPRASFAAGQRRRGFV